MRLTTRLFANPVAPAAKGAALRPAPLALLPPIPLYRRILRAHRRKLGPEERLMGDMYVKSEFRQHKTVENPMHIIGFLTEWQMYAQQLEGDSWKDGHLDKAKLDKMSDEQLAQLYELMQTIRKEQDEGDGSDPCQHSGGDSMSQTMAIPGLWSTATSLAVIGLMCNPLRLM